MLVLSRKEGESFSMLTPGGETITVRLNGTEYGRASIGIEAPKAVKILRDDLIKKSSKWSKRFGQ